MQDPSQSEVPFAMSRQHMASIIEKTVNRHLKYPLRPVIEKIKSSKSIHKHKVLCVLNPFSPESFLLRSIEIPFTLSVT